MEICFFSKVTPETWANLVGAAGTWGAIVAAWRLGSAGERQRRASAKQQLELVCTYGTQSFSAALRQARSNNSGLFREVVHALEDAASLAGQLPLTELSSADVQRALNLRRTLVEALAMTNEVKADDMAGLYRCGNRLNFLYEQFTKGVPWQHRHGVWTDKEEFGVSGKQP